MARQGADGRFGRGGRAGPAEPYSTAFNDIPGISQAHPGCTTSHPNEFTPRLVGPGARLPRPGESTVHLPVQHGRRPHPDVRMKRRLPVLECGKSTIRKAGAAGAASRSATNLLERLLVIAGFFPGEGRRRLQAHTLFSGTLTRSADRQFQFLLSPEVVNAGRLAARRHPHSVSSNACSAVRALLKIQRGPHQRHAGSALASESWVEEPQPQEPLSELMGRTEYNPHRQLRRWPQSRQAGRALIDVQVVQALPHSLRGEWCCRATRSTPPRPGW